MIKGLPPKSRPIIFAFSNPTPNLKRPQKILIRWTNRHAVVTTGSPFTPVNYDGRKIPIAQCNNVYIFPAVGRGVVASSARRIRDAMMLTAGRTLAVNSPACKDHSAPLLAPITDLRRVAAEIAVAVAIAAQKDEVAGEMIEDELNWHGPATQWTPDYLSYCD